MLGKVLQPPGITISGVLRSGIWTKPSDPNYSAISIWTTDGSTPTYAVTQGSNPYIQYRDVTDNTTALPGNNQVTLGSQPIWIETA